MTPFWGLTEIEFFLRRNSKSTQYLRQNGFFQNFQMWHFGADPIHPINAFLVSLYIYICLTKVTIFYCTIFTADTNCNGLSSSPTLSLLRPKVASSPKKPIWRHWPRIFDQNLDFIVMLTLCRLHIVDVFENWLNKTDRNFKTLKKKRPK